MSPKTKEIIEMLNILPDEEQEFAYELVKRLVIAWDPDYTRLTLDEEKSLQEAQESGYIKAEDIDWDNLDKMDLE
jgi:hypothetical protein